MDKISIVTELVSARSISGMLICVAPSNLVHSTANNPALTPEIYYMANKHQHPREHAEKTNSTATLKRATGRCG